MARFSMFTGKMMAAFGIAVVSACVPHLPSRGAVDLREVDTRVVRFGFDAPRGGICPGQPLDLDVELVTDDGEHLYRTRHEIEDSIFDLRQIRLTSAQGHFNSDGRFFPDADPRTSVQTGFVFFVHVPRGPTFMARYPPVYECEAMLGHEGARGVDGGEGADALLEDDVERTGKPPNNVNNVQQTPQRPAAANGFTGGEGGMGSDGPSFTVYVTWVRTPDYTKLLAARTEGDLDSIALRAPGNTLAVVARGGEGGTGGHGGDGAGTIETVLRYTRRGRKISDLTRGGPGGLGGVGGVGGAGGNVRVVLDDRFDDLEKWVSVDANGGNGGPGGRGGRGGDATATQRGYRESSDFRGVPGQGGQQGRRGRAGTSSFERAHDVQAKFEHMGSIIPL